MSYSDVFKIKLERDFEEHIAAGDLVRTGPNLYPHYQVVAVDGAMAWVRNVQNGLDHITPLNRCRKITD